jgi:hypothetical protein
LDLGFANFSFALMLSSGELLIRGSLGLHLVLLKKLLRTLDLAFTFSSALMVLLMFRVAFTGKRFRNNEGEAGLTGEAG